MSGPKLLLFILFMLEYVGNIFLNTFDPGDQIQYCKLRNRISPWKIQMNVNVW